MQQPWRLRTGYLHNGCCLRQSELKKRGNAAEVVVSKRVNGSLSDFSPNLASDLRSFFPFSMQKFHKSSLNHCNLRTRATCRTTPVKNKRSKSQSSGCLKRP